MQANLTFLIASLEGGGIQKATVRMLQEFIRQGYPVTLLVVNDGGPLREELPAQCRLVSLGAARSRHALFKLIRYLQAARPSILISAQTHINILAILARLVAGAPRHLIVCEHISLAGAAHSRAGLFERLRPSLIRVFYPLASRVVAVSRDAAQGLRELAGLRGDVHVIHNGLDPEALRRLAEQPVQHRWLNTDDFKVILGIGRLSPQKDFATLLRAFAQLPAADSRLVILGEGPERAALTALARELRIEERVDLPGFVRNPYAYLGACEVFVLSSKWEGFANVVIEALACGAPIVYTDCPGGPADILADRGLGRMVAVDHVSAMAAAIQQTLDQKWDKTPSLRYAYEFSIENTVRQYIILLESLN